MYFNGQGLLIGTLKGFVGRPGAPCGTPGSLASPIRLVIVVEVLAVQVTTLMTL